VTTGRAADNGVTSAPAVLSQKRPGDGLPKYNRKSQKLNHKSTPGGGNGQAGKKRPRKPQTCETELQKNTYLQVGRYLLDQFSVPAFHSHTNISLVDHDRIQFYHANHSVILVSSGLSFLKDNQTGRLHKFIVIVIAFGRLTLRDNGILQDLHGQREASN